MKKYKVWYQDGSNTIIETTANPVVTKTDKQLKIRLGKTTLKDVVGFTEICPPIVIKQ